MNPYTRRLLGFLCLSMGLALALGPYPGKRLKERTVNAVFLSAVALAEPATRPACLEKAIEIDANGLEKFAEIKKAVVQLEVEPLKTNQVQLHSRELGAFIKHFGSKEGNHLCFRYKGRKYKLVSTLIYKFGWLYLVALEKTPADIPKVPMSRLEAYPVLKAYIQSLDSAAEEAGKISDQSRAGLDKPQLQKQPDFSSHDTGKALERMQREFERINRRAQNQMNAIKFRQWDSIYAEKRRDMDWDKWVALSREVGSSPENVRFTCGSYLILGRSEALTEDVLLSVAWFKPFRYIFAGAFLLVGVLVMRRVYGKRPGIPLNPRWAACVGDVIIISFLGFGAFCLIDYGLVRFLGMTSIVYEPVSRGMCAIGYLPVTLFFAYFAANLGGQSMEIDSKGIKIYYPGSDCFLPWDAITGFDLKRTYIAVGRAGTLMPRKLQTKLVIKTAASTNSVVEPGLRETKISLIRALRAASPERLHADLDALSEEW